ncbi:hypothetical protein [Mucilaginibacter pedocola]|nr:hypothetical protein [Mucilaginibacter pedocola]
MAFNGADLKINPKVIERLFGITPMKFVHHIAIWLCLQIIVDTEIGSILCKKTILGKHTSEITAIKVAIEGPATLAVLGL